MSTYILYAYKLFNMLNNIYNILKNCMNVLSFKKKKLWERQNRLVNYNVSAVCLEWKFGLGIRRVV